MPIHGKFPALAAGLICLGPFAAVAQNPNDVGARMAAMEDRIKTLEAEIQDLKSQQAATTAALTAATPAAPAPATQTQAAALAESATAQRPKSLSRPSATKPRSASVLIVSQRGDVAEADR